jgi:hypothetical protein
MKEQLITVSKTRRVAEATITPEVAQELLNRQSDLQRKVNAIHLGRLTNVMANGSWKDLNGDSIKFDKDGFLIDGQHRLLAVINSKKTIKTYVALGLDKDDIYFIDLWHKTRGTSDVFKMKGVDNYCVIASAAASLWRYDNGSFADKVTYPDPEETFKYFMQNQGLIISAKYGETVKKMIGKSLATFLHYTFARINQNQASRFFEDWSTGANLNADSPILQLRNRLMYNKREDVQMKLDPVNQVALVILAWNAIRENKKYTKLRWTGNAFPEAI